MRLHQLTESRSEPVNIKRFPIRDFSDMIEKPIYRGITGVSAKYLLVNPMVGAERTARSTGNYINLLVSNSKLWEEYPPRNRAVIGTTDESNAIGYGDGFAYRMLPMNGATIGICSAGDFWDSFKTKIAGIPIAPDIMVSDLRRMANSFGMILSETSYSKFKSQIKQLDAKIRSNPIDFKRLYYKGLKKELKESSLWEIVEAKFAPTGFKLTNTKSFAIKGHHEVWTSHPVLLVRTDCWQSVLNLL